MVRYPNLEAELARAGINRLQLAAALGVSAPAITYKMRTGKNVFTHDEVIKVFELLGTNYTEDNYKYLFKVIEVDK